MAEATCVRDRSSREARRIDIALTPHVPADRFLHRLHVRYLAFRCRSTRPGYVTVPAGRGFSRVVWGIRPNGMKLTYACGGMVLVVGSGFDDVRELFRPPFEPPRTEKEQKRCQVDFSAHVPKLV